MSNSINYAEVFNSALDEQYAILPKTGFMELNSMGIRWVGGKKVQIPKLALQGLGTVSGCNVPEGDYDFDYEEKSLQWDRGRTFKIPRHAVDETNFALTAGNIVSVFLKTKVVPEIDMLRLSTAATAAITASHVTYGGTTLVTPLKSLIEDIAKVQDKIGEDVQLYIPVAQTIKAQIMASAEISKYLSVRDYEVRSVNIQMDAINDQYLIGVPSAYMKSKFTLLDGKTSGQEAGGVTPAGDAVSVNWLIVAADSVLACAYPRVEKVIDPDTNQTGDCWIIMVHTYHGLFVLDNKLDGLWVNLATTDPSEQ